MAYPEPKNGIIYIPAEQKCPVCGYQSRGSFPIKHYEGGSGGLRTFTCPKCGVELAE